MAQARFGESLDGVVVAVEPHETSIEVTWMFAQPDPNLRDGALDLDVDTRAKTVTKHIRRIPPDFLGPSRLDLNRLPASRAP